MIWIHSYHYTSSILNLQIIQITDFGYRNFHRRIHGVDRYCIFRRVKHYFFCIHVCLKLEIWKFVTVSSPFSSHLLLILFLILTSNHSIVPYNYSHDISVFPGLFLKVTWRPLIWQPSSCHSWSWPLVFSLQPLSSLQKSCVSKWLFLEFWKHCTAK